MVVRLPRTAKTAVPASLRGESALRLWCRLNTIAVSAEEGESDVSDHRPTMTSRRVNNVIPPSSGARQSLICRRSSVLWGSAPEGRVLPIRAPFRPPCAIPKPPITFRIICLRRESPPVGVAPAPRRLGVCQCPTRGKVISCFVLKSLIIGRSFARLCDGVLKPQMLRRGRSRCSRTRSDARWFAIVRRILTPPSRVRLFDRWRMGRRGVPPRESVPVTAPTPRRECRTSCLIRLN